MLARPRPATVHQRPIVVTVTRRNEPTGVPRSGAGNIPSGQQPRLEISAALSPEDVISVTMLTEAATETDGVRPLSEHVSLRLRYGGGGQDQHILLLLPDQRTDSTASGLTTAGDVLVGYAHLDPTDAVTGSAVELVVHPAYRRRGYGRLLVAIANEQSPDGRLRLWAHGDHPAARRLAESMGLRAVRRLERMRRSLRSPPPEPQLPATVRLRTFRPGDDDADWLRLNARVFAGHPEQGSWTQRDLSARMQEPWFDAEGFFIAEEDGPDGPRMIAFHWTKIHSDGANWDRGDRVRLGMAIQQQGQEPSGEVYVVGVDPDQRGRGLGRSLTIAGLRWLRARGMSQAMLYVDAGNESALAVYRSLGFTRWGTDVMFSRAVP